MAEIEFTIDTKTGEFRMHIHGIAGPACEDVARLVKDLTGEPGHEEVTAEYRLRPHTHARTSTRIQSKGT